MLLAAGCSTPSGEPQVRTVFHVPALPAEARKRCDAPSAIPPRDLTAAEVAGLWGRDRVALKICETRRAAAVAAVEGGR